MKKLIAIAVLMSVGTQVVSAADFTLRPYLGYGFGTSQQPMIAPGGAGGADAAQNMDTGKFTKSEAINYSAGAGMKFGVGVDIGINDYLSFEPMIGYSMGSETDTDILKMTAPVGAPGVSQTNTLTDSTSFMPFSVTMKIRAKAGKFTPYAGFGPTLALSPKTIRTYKETGVGLPAAPGLVSREEETTYDMGIGFHGVVGTDYNVSDSFVIFFQARADQISLHQDTAKLTKSTVDGVSDLAAMNKCNKETTYKDDNKGINGTDGISDVTKPAVAKVDPISASSVAINFGVSYKF